MVETYVCWYLQGNQDFRGSWVVQDFVHPQYVLIERKLVTPPPHDDVGGQKSQCQ